MRQVARYAIFAMSLAASARGQQPPVPAGGPETPRAPTDFSRTGAQPNSDLIGQPIAPPPVTAWPVGKAVSEFDSGTVYVYWLHDPPATCNLLRARPHYRHYFGQLAAKHADRAVVVEVLARDGQQTTLGGERVDSAAQDPFVRSRVGVCESRAFEDWCGTRRSNCSILAVVVDSQGRLAAVTYEYADVPWIVEQVLAGAFDHAKYTQTCLEFDSIRAAPKKETAADRLGRLERAHEVLPCRYAYTECLRAELLARQGRYDEAVTIIRAALKQATIIDRSFLQDVVTLTESVELTTDALRPIGLEVATLLASTSNLQNYLDLIQTAEIAARLRDYDTAIMYQTMAVGRAREGPQRDEAMKKLGEYQAASGK